MNTREEMNMYMRKWKKANLGKVRLYKEQYNIRYPWMSNLSTARARCNNKNNISYRNYGGRGIRCLLSPKQIKVIYIRDNAKNMKCATLDRIDGDKNYSVSNCRFLERSENTRLAVSKKKKFIIKCENCGCTKLIKVPNESLG